MAGRMMGVLFRPGWRLRCVNPPIAWLQMRDEGSRSVAIRLQLTMYLTSRAARVVKIKDAQLVVEVAERRFVVPWSLATDVDGELLGEGGEIAIYSDEPQHALVEFETDSPEIVALLAAPGPPLPMTVEALLNDAIEFRRIADLDLARESLSSPSEDWCQVGTGRERESKAKD